MLNVNAREKRYFDQYGPTVTMKLWHYATAYR